MARLDTPEYRKAYNAGWRYSQRPTATLDHADRTGKPEAWYDGYLDLAAGRDKWHTLHCTGCEDHPAIKVPSPAPATTCQRATKTKPLCGQPAVAFATLDGVVFLTVCHAHATVHKGDYRIDKADYERRVQAAK
jgi:hypothetical protein